MDKCDREKLIPIGYLPWKLIKSDIIQDNRINNWYEQIACPIKQTIHNMDIISKSENPEKIYYQLYPKKKIIYDNEEDIIQENIELNINDMINCIINE